METKGKQKGNMAKKIELVNVYINANQVPKSRKVGNLTSYEKLLIAKEVLGMMIDAKQNQIQDEPKEEIWKEEQSQFYKVLGTMDTEEESWYNPCGRDAKLYEHP